MFVLAALSVSATAQWLNFPTKGIPRLPDGKPDLSAPAPKTAEGKPDLSGMWQMRGPKFLQNIAADLKPEDVPMLPAAAAIYKHRHEEAPGIGESDSHCLPQGVPKINATPVPFKIIQAPGLVLILYEAFNLFRQVFTDGRPLPKDPNPTWLGYSIGRWDGDTLVVESTGFNDETWLDQAGHPHSEALHVTERFRRVNFGNMDLQVTIDDPKMYSKPWTVKQDPRLVPDTEILEFICNENERDAKHLVGK
jgi:hypothetical protein